MPLPKELLRYTFLLCSNVLVTASHTNPTRSIPINSTIRILPIGDSITYGYGSSTGNGYRLSLLDLLSPTPVLYLGSQHSGNLTGNDASDGYSGALISEIAAYVLANGSLSLLPDVVLIMAGTNDMNKDVNATTAPQRLGSLIDEVVAACPSAAVVVAGIIPIQTSEAETRVLSFNDAIPGLVAERVGMGKRVVGINMSDYLTVNDTADMFDGLHPNDGGYALLAKGWYDGIAEAAEKGWVSGSGNATAMGVSRPAATNKVNSGLGLRGSNLWIVVGMFLLLASL